MKISLPDAVYIAVCYADVFQFPLSVPELCTWTPFFSSLSQSSVRRAIKTRGLKMSGDFVFLPGCKHYVAKRRKRQAYVKQKKEIARSIALQLKRIQTIELIGISGGVAFENVGRDDDVDIFIVTTAGCIYTTRLFAVLALDSKGMRRRPGDTTYSDKACLNMFMAANALSFAKKEKNMYIAYELLHMHPEYEKNNTYKALLKKNAWAAYFYPSVYKKKLASVDKRKTQSNKHKTTGVFKELCRMLEPFARSGQMIYMQNKRTKEVVTQNRLKFHPDDAQNHIKNQLANRLIKKNISLDKIWLHS